jgi:hypothetical protein
MSTGPKKDKSSAGHVWAAGFHHVHSCLADILKLTNRFFPIFFLDNSKPWVTETADTEPADRGTCLFYCQKLKFMLVYSSLVVSFTNFYLLQLAYLFCISRFLSPAVKT